MRRRSVVNLRAVTISMYSSAQDTHFLYSCKHKVRETNVKYSFNLARKEYTKNDILGQSHFER